MTSFDPKAFEIYRHDSDNLVGGYKNVMLQVRNGKLSTEALHYMETMGKLLLTRAAGPCGAFLIVEDGAPIADADLRREQTRVMKGFFAAHPRCYLTGAILGGGIGATMLKSVYRVLLIGQSRLYSCGSVEEGAAWMSPRLGLPRDELVALGHWGRSLANEPPLSSRR